MHWRLYWFHRATKARRLKAANAFSRVRVPEPDDTIALAGRLSGAFFRNTTSRRWTIWSAERASASDRCSDCSMNMSVSVL